MFRNVKNPMSWLTPRSMQISPRAKLVSDEEAQKLRERLSQVSYRPQNGFLVEEPVRRIR
jgi:hypothetical protein